VVTTMSSQAPELSRPRQYEPAHSRESFWKYDASSFSEGEVAELKARLSNDLDATSPYEFSEAEIAKLRDLHNCLKQSREDRQRTMRFAEDYTSRLDGQFATQAGGHA
jgi:hypothetical protein